MTSSAWLFGGAGWREFRSDKTTYPNVGEDRVVRAFAIPAKVLGHDSSDGHGHSDKAVVVDADPYNVEPGETTLWRPPRTTLAAAAFGEPIDGPDPRLHRVHGSKILLLFVQVGGHIMAHEGEEGRDGEGLVAVAENLEVYRMPVVPYAEECGG